MKNMRRAKAGNFYAFAALALALAAPSRAFAACSSPAGNAGDIVYSGTQSIMAYCNGTSWVGMGVSPLVNLTTQVTGVLGVANGGTNVSSASGTALDNITGFTGTGFLQRTGPGAYSFTSNTMIYPSAGLIVSTGTGWGTSLSTLSATYEPAHTGDVTNNAGSLALTVTAIQGTTVSGTTGSGSVVFSASPTFTGTVTDATTPVNSTDVANKAYVDAAGSSCAKWTGTWYSQTFTSSGTWTLPTNGVVGNQVWILAVGGGGGGGGGTSYNNLANSTPDWSGGGGGGGGGGITFESMNVNTNLTVTIGAGGTGGAGGAQECSSNAYNQGTSGGTGGNTIVTSVSGGAPFAVIGNGGSGGVAPTGGGGPGGQGGLGGNGLYGQPGQLGNQAGAITIGGGGGGGGGGNGGGPFNGTGDGGNGGGGAGNGTAGSTSCQNGGSRTGCAGGTGGNISAGGGATMVNLTMGNGGTGGNGCSYNPSYEYLCGGGGGGGGGYGAGGNGGSCSPTNISTCAAASTAGTAGTYGGGGGGGGAGGYSGSCVLASASGGAGGSGYAIIYWQQ